MAYAFVTDNDNLNVRTTLEYSIKKIIWLIGFTIEEQRNSNYNYSIYSFSDIRIFTENNISDF